MDNSGETLILLEGWQRLGFQVLFKTLSSAAFMCLAGTPVYFTARYLVGRSEALDSLEFISNGGIESIISEFCLELNSEVIENEFFRFLRNTGKANYGQYRQVSDNSASSESGQARI